MKQPLNGIRIPSPYPPHDPEIEWLVAEWAHANEQRRCEIEDYLRNVIRYEKCKKQIQFLALTPAAYEDAIKRLTAALGI